MKIPINDSINYNLNKFIKSKPLNLKILNNLNLKKIDRNKFPLIKILKLLPSKNSLYETALLTINDFYVHKFLNNDIDFENLIRIISKTVKRKDFLKYKNIRPKNIDHIYNLRNYVRLKLENLGVSVIFYVKNYI